MNAVALADGVHAAGPIKVVHLITGLGMGGAETMLYKLLANMDLARFPARVVSMTTEGSLGSRIRALGVRVDALGLSRGVPNPSSIPKLVRILREDRACILQTWLYHADLLGLVAAKLARVPHLVWNIRCSDMEVQGRTPQLRAVTAAHALCARLPEAVIVNSRCGMNFHIARGHRPKRWELIQNGFDTSRFRPDERQRAERRAELGLEASDVVIGMTARYDPMKDHETFLLAASQLRRTQPNVKFVLAGTDVTPDNRALAALIERGNLVPHTRLLGECSDVAKLLPAFDIATLCSISEGFPNAVGEAMSAALPCVASDVGDSALLLADAGRVVPPRDVTALTRVWEDLIALGPSGRSELGARARQKIVDLYSLTRIVGRYEELYSDLASAVA